MKLVQKLKIIVLTEKYGDLGNRLFRFSRLYLSKPNNVVLFDFSFFQYVHLYSPKLFEWFILFKFLSFLNNERLHLIQQIFNNPKYAYQIDPPSDFSKSEFWTFDSLFDKVQNSDNYIHHIHKRAFFCKQTKLNTNNQDRLKQIFNLKKKYVRNADRLLSTKKPDSYLVGVHIRRGDYAQFRDGELYFDDKLYLNAIKTFKKTITQNKNIEFLLLSNEVLNIKSYSETALLYFGLQHPGIDQALLARCDHILGVESTFSAWPSFLHNIPRTLISLQGNVINLNNVDILFS